MQLIKKKLQCITALICAVTVLLAADPVLAFGEERKTSSGITFDNIEAEIEHYAADKTYPSFETAVFCGDEVLYTGCFGYADVENQIPADEETVYEWGSITKTLTWVSVMQLWEQGKLDLEADIRTFLPEEFLQNLFYDTPITMLDLMNHKAGFQDTVYEMAVMDESEITSLPDTLQAIEPAQINRPGTFTAYSNWGTALAGYIVECISGETYEEYVHNHIFEPLGMEHTAVSAAYTDNLWVREKREKLKTYALTDENGMESLECLGDGLWYILLYPAGSATGTIGDLTTYAQSFVNKNTPLFEHSDTLDKMLSATSFIGSTGIPNNCHGLWADQYAVEVLGHNGNTLGCSANMCFDRTTGIGTVVLTNQSGSELCYEIPKLLFGDALDNPLFTPSEITEPIDLSGFYVSNRSTPKGIAKITNIINILPVNRVSENEYSVIGMATITQISDTLFLLSMDSATYPIAVEMNNSGRKIIRFTSSDYIEDPTVPFQIAAIILYIISALVSLVFLLIKLIRRFRKTTVQYSGAGLITAGQLAKIVSVIMILVLMLRMMSGWGVDKTEGICIACVQAICLIICAVTAVSSVVMLFSRRDDKAKNSKYILNVLANIFAVCFSVYFELFRFWGV